MSIKIGNNDITDVKLGNTQVNSIYLGSAKVWEKVVDPTANLIQFPSSSVVCSYSASDGAINIKGFKIPDQTGTQYKVYWRLNRLVNTTMPPAYDENYLCNFPFKKGSSSTASDSKFGLGTARANSSNEIQSGTAQYGLTLTDQLDLSSYHSGDDDFVHGEFTITPGTSSGYPNKCLSIIQLESLYAKSGGGIITPSAIRTIAYNLPIDMYINNEKIEVPAYKTVRFQLEVYIGSTLYYYRFSLAIEKVS